MSLEENLLEDILKQGVYHRFFLFEYDIVYWWKSILEVASNPIYGIKITGKSGFNKI